MRKDLSRAIDVPARLCYSNCDTALPLHTGCVSHFSSPPAAECYPPPSLPAGGIFLFRP